MVHVIADLSKEGLVILLLLSGFLTEVDSTVESYAGNEHDVNTNDARVGGLMSKTCNQAMDTDGGISCHDIDECEFGSDLCDVNATCSNNVGGYDCTCNTGWSGDGFNCKDIEECRLRLDNCSINAECTNTQGSYTCACRTGWIGDGFTCTVLHADP